jgi:hypothetical protein
MNAPRGVALMPSGAEVLAITVKKRRRRILAVSDRAIPLRATRASGLEVVISTKKQRRRVARFASHLGPGAVAFHLPRSLRTGKQRLTKDHYVLSMTATAGSESASHIMELIVK